MHIYIDLENRGVEFVCIGRRFEDLAEYAKRRQKKSGEFTFTSFLKFRFERDVSYILLFLFGAPRWGVVISLDEQLDVSARMNARLKRRYPESGHKMRLQYLHMLH